MEQECVERVHPKGRYGSFHTYRCRNKATVQREGKWYCGTHDPERIKARQEKRDQERRQEMERNDQAYNSGAAQVRRLIKLLGDDMEYEVGVDYAKIGRTHRASGIRISNRAAARLITLLEQS